MLFIKTNTEDLGFTFVAIRKNASSSIANSIYSFKNKINYDHADFPKDINHSNILNYFSQGVGENLFKFTCIRDPFERLVSGFTHKVLQHPHVEIKHYDEFFPNHRILINDTQEYFNSFLAFLEQCNFSEIDPHFALQYDCAKFDTIEYDLVIDQSDIKSGWAEVQKYIPGMPNLPQKSIHHSGSENLLDILSPFKDRVKTLYSKDYDLFK